VAWTDFSYESFDPIYYESFWGFSMYDPLLTWDAKGNFTGKVAESWSISPDGKTWTFKIRKDIKFWNGDPLTAADVKFSVDRFGGKDSTNPWSHYLNESYNKVSSSLIDDYTFQYVTARAEPSLVIPFAWTRILPKSYFEKVGQDAFRKAPMGSGPWKFVSYVSKNKCTMEANTNYWIPALVPSFKTLEVLLVPEVSTQVNMLKNNEVDMVSVPMDSIVQLQKAGFKTVEMGEPTQVNISFQGTWLKSAGAAGDIRVRQAMSYAINREEVGKGYFNGNAVPGGYFYMLPGDYGWDDSWKPDAYDTGKAKQLLAEAGYPNNYPDPTIHIYVSPGPNVDLLTLLQNYWKAVGITVKLEIVDSAVFGGYFFSPATRIKEGDKNAGWAFPWVFGSFFNSTYHSANMYTSQGAHNTCNDTKADQLYKDATSEIDPKLALQKWTAFQTYVHTLYINIGFCYVKPLVAYGPAISGFTGPNWMGREDAYCGFQRAAK
jgi:ABC-type transport system substrate-binding protein